MTFSWLTCTVLVLIAAATFVMTELLAMRWTKYRRYFLLRDWASQHGLRVFDKGAWVSPLPANVTQVLDDRRVRWSLGDGRLSMIRLQANCETYNLLVAPIQTDWPPTALRPTMWQSCLLDRLNLFNYPSQYGVQRFTLHGEHPQAARRLSDSHIRGLLPADLAILLVGRHMVIDFSSRAFDPIELDRMIALANQLLASVPPAPGQAAGESAT